MLMLSRPLPTMAHWQSGAPVTHDPTYHPCVTKQDAA
jgi:hypothetical protein